MADAHLRPGLSEAAGTQNARLERLLAEAADRAGHVVFLGDMFHLWLERRGRLAGDYEGILRLLARMADGRPRGWMRHVCGNRDFAAGAALPAEGGSEAPFAGFFRGKDRRFPSRLAQAGVTPEGAWWDIRHGGRGVRLLHGDRYCLRQPFFQALRWLLAGPVGRTLAWRLPWPMLRTLAEFLQNRRRRPSTLATPALQERNQKRIAQKPVARAVAGGADLVVVGHLHQGFTREVPLPGGRTGRLVSLPAFCDGWYGVMENGQVELRRMEK